MRRSDAGLDAAAAAKAAILTGPGVNNSSAETREEVCGQVVDFDPQQFPDAELRIRSFESHAPLSLTCTLFAPIAL